MEDGKGTPSSLRTRNQRVVLDRLRAHGPTTRPRVARATGLSKPTVGQALADLEGFGLVRAAGTASAGTGRSAIVYEADPAAGYVLGVDVGRNRIRCAVADLAGAVVARCDERNDARSGAALVRAVAGHAEDAVAAAGVRAGDVVARVLGSPGVPGGRRLRRAPNLPGWGRAGLLDDLEAALGAGLVVENDANLAAIGEYEQGAARDTASFVSIAVGTGIGMGIVLDGRLLRGANGAAGEVGYLPFGWPGGGAAPAGGLLESAAAARSVVAMARERGLSGVRAAKDVFDLAADGDRRARAAVAEEADRLAFVVASVTAILDPELVVLCGGIGGNVALLAEPMGAALGRALPAAPPIVAGALGDAAVLTGALSLGLAGARETVFDRCARAGS